MSLDYFDKWTVWLEPIVTTFKWIELREMPQWSDGQHPIKSTVDLLMEKKIIQRQEHDQIFADYGHIKTFLKAQPNIYKEWNDSKVSIQKRWMHVFAYLKSNGTSFENFAKIIEYAMMIPGWFITKFNTFISALICKIFCLGTNGDCERVFSLMQYYWTDKKSNLSLGTLKAWLLTKNNLDFSCVDLHAFIKSKPDILKKVRTDKF